jgi:hypothetical protein
MIFISALTRYQPIQGIFITISLLAFFRIAGKSLRYCQSRCCGHVKRSEEAVLVGPRPTFIRLAFIACVRRLLYLMSENISTPQGSTWGSVHLTPDMALDERLYDLTEEERTFFKQQTGIPTDDEPKAHLFQVQAESYEVLHP